MNLVLKDIGLFDRLARDKGLQLELSPLLVEIFSKAIDTYGPREFSPNIIRRYEESSGLSVRAPGFPAEILDDKPEEAGSEVIVRRG